MSVYKRLDSPYYWFDFVMHGQRYQGSTKLRNRVAAERAEGIFREQVAMNAAGIPPKRNRPPLLREYAAEFLETVKLENKPKTHLSYKGSVAQLLPRFGSKRLDEIDAGAIAKFKEHRLEQGREGSTINRDLACLRRMLSLAMKKGIIESSPFAARRVEFLPENRRERILTFTEERKYLAAARQPLRDVATIILEMGLRPEEVFEMYSRNMHVAANPAYVHVPDGKTPAARRDVPMTERALAVIRRRVARAKGGYLFPLRVGNGYDHSRPMITVQKAHEEALHDSGLKPPFRLYDCRHTYGTRYIEGGGDSLELAKLMGHTDLSTTRRYVHLSKRHLAAAQQRIERFRVESEIAEAEQEAARRGTRSARPT